MKIIIYLNIKKSKKKKILLITFEKLNFEKKNNIEIYIFYTNFFRELFFLTLKLNFLYSSTPDLGQTIFKKSRFSKCKYIFLQHAPVSLTMVYSPKAFDSFDAVQAINTHQFEEMNEIKKKKKLKTKVFKSKYLFLSGYPSRNNEDGINLVDLLIAPSWNSQFYQLNCHLQLKDLLDKNNINYILRPHPMSLKNKEINLKDLKKNNIKFDLSSKANLRNFKFLVSDWSGIFLEFAIITKRKAFLINTPKKILNKNYSDYKNIPIEISSRNLLAKTFEINEIGDLVKELKDNKNNFDNNSFSFENKNITQKIQEIFYN